MEGEEEKERIEKVTNVKERFRERERKKEMYKKIFRG